MKSIQTTVLATIAAFVLCGCSTHPAPAVTSASFPWPGILRVEEGMTIAEAKEITGQTYPRNGKFHNDTANIETFCTVELADGVFTSVVSGHNGVCVEYNP